MSQGILSLAKQGNPRAIAALINHSTQPQGIKVQVARQEDCLHVLFESARAPNQQDAVALICNSMKILKVEPIQTVKIYGRQGGEKSVAWSQVIRMTETTNQLSSKVHDSDVPDITVSPVTPSEAQVPEAQADDFQAAIAPSSVEPNASELSDLPSETVAAEPPELPEAIAVPAELAPAEPDPDWLRRPEAVILVIFVSMVLLWQLYIDLLNEAEADSLSGKELADRLGINQSTISRRKERADFSAWTQSLDPDGIGWVYQNHSFVPKLQTDGYEDPIAG